MTFVRAIQQYNESNDNWETIQSGSTTVLKREEESTVPTDDPAIELINGSYYVFELSYLILAEISTKVYSVNKSLHIIIILINTILYHMLYAICYMPYTPYYMYQSDSHYTFELVMNKERQSAIERIDRGLSCAYP